jgi:hypothetical protein
VPEAVRALEAAGIMRTYLVVVEFDALDLMA